MPFLTHGWPRIQTTLDRMFVAWPVLLENLDFSQFLSLLLAFPPAPPSFFFKVKLVR